MLGCKPTPGVETVCPIEGELGVVEPPEAVDVEPEELDDVEPEELVEVDPVDGVVVPLVGVAVLVLAGAVKPCSDAKIEARSLPGFPVSRFCPPGPL